MPTGNPYLTFSSPNSFTLNVVDYQKYWDGTIEYSTDTTTWNVWGGTTTINSSSSGTTNYLYLRGTGNTYITGSSASISAGYWKLRGSNISCEGNIENLLDYATVVLGNHPVMANKCYQYMFNDCTSLISAPELPATVLTNYCYQMMFNHCTSLTDAPALSATTLATWCYAHMFRNCTSLTSTPELPKTTLANYCYFAMFEGCTSLTQAPELPATNLATQCYSYMFQDCTSLASAPELPATTLVQSCYGYMFEGCTSLINVPELPATTLVQGCYSGMFRGCANIKLSTTQTGNYKILYRIPTSGTGTDATDALTDMFSNTGGTFTGTPSLNTTYYLCTYQPISSFGDLEVVDNDTYITLTVNGVSVDVKLEPVASGYEVTFTDSMQWNNYAQNLDTAEYSIDNGSTWVSIPNTLPLTIQANQIMLKLGYGSGGDLKPKAVCNDIGLDTGYISVSSQQTSNYTLTNNITIDLSILYDD